ncbi:hypothetical protein OG528_29820 [Streptomyces platensis]
MTERAQAVYAAQRMLAETMPFASLWVTVDQVHWGGLQSALGTRSLREALLPLDTEQYSVLRAPLAEVWRTMEPLRAMDPGWREDIVLGWDSSEMSQWTPEQEATAWERAQVLLPHLETLDDAMRQVAGTTFHPQKRHTSSSANRS